MARIGVSLSIDVTKIDKSLLFEGKKGKYLDATVFIDIDQKDQFDNNGMITQSVKKDDPRGSILGNCKVFWSDSVIANEGASAQHVSASPPQQGAIDQFDDDIPF